MGPDEIPWGSRLVAHSETYVLPKTAPRRDRPSRRGPSGHGSDKAKTGGWPCQNGASVANQGSGGSPKSDTFRRALWVRTNCRNRHCLTSLRDADLLLTTLEREGPTFTTQKGHVHFSQGRPSDVQHPVRTVARVRHPAANLTAVLEQQILGAAHRPHLHGEIVARVLLRLQAAVHGPDRLCY